MTHYGLTAGMRYGEVVRMQPGMIIDMYVMRQRYDDEQHGIKRKKETIYD